MNAFDKLCAAMAFALGLLFVVFGRFGTLFGCSGHFRLPPILGVLPAFVGWGIVRAVYLAWQLQPASNEPLSEDLQGLPTDRRDAPAE